MKDLRGLLTLDEEDCAVAESVIATAGDSALTTRTAINEAAKVISRAEEVAGDDGVDSDSYTAAGGECKEHASTLEAMAGSIDAMLQKWPAVRVNDEAEIEALRNVARDAIDTSIRARDTAARCSEAARKRAAALAKEAEERATLKRNKIEAARTKFAGATEDRFKEVRKRTETVMPLTNSLICLCRNLTSLTRSEQAVSLAPN